LKIIASESFTFTGVPSFLPGLNLADLTASIAASSQPAPIPLTTFTWSTLPFSFT